MKDEAKTKKQLIGELADLRRLADEERRRAADASTAWQEEKADWEGRRTSCGRWGNS